MPQIKSSFILNSSQPNFERDRCYTLNDLKSVVPSSLDDGHIVYCEETKKHYIFRSDYEVDGNTGRFRELLLQDVQVVENISDLIGDNQYQLNHLPVGKLVYCQEDSQIYYKYDKNGRTGFKLLIDLQSSNYISTTSQEWLEVAGNITDLKNAGMLVFNTVNDMSNVPSILNYKSGQLAYCKENNHHYYLPDSPTRTGLFGYFRTVCDESDKYPKLTQPSSSISIKQIEYERDGWSWFTRNGETILLIPYDDKDYAVNHVSDYISVNINRGVIDYNDFPYWVGERIIPYTGTSDLVDFLTPIDTPFVIGNNRRHINHVPVEGSTPIVKDIDGIDVQSISWGTEPISSNDIIVNVTRPWKATTESGTPSNQPLIPWESEMEGTAVLIPTCQGSQKIVIPEGRTPQNVKIYINVLGEWYDETHEWNRNGQTFTYDAITNGQRGNVKIKVVF